MKKPIFPEDLVRRIRRALDENKTINARGIIINGDINFFRYPIVLNTNFSRDLAAPRMQSKGLADDTAKLKTAIFGA